MKSGSLLDTLSHRALKSPQRIALSFLEDGEHVGSELTYAQLEGQARALAHRLRSLNLTGERALLLYPPGLDFIVGFLGCLYAGVVAVPAYPPRRRRPEDRLRAIIQDCEPAACLSLSSLHERVEDLRRSVPAFGNTAWISTDDLNLEPPPADWRGPEITPDTLAFLQYTSGSTADPKGVQISHGNLLHNEAMIADAFQQSEDSVVVGWLPLYHDMGLIGNVLQPLYLGAQCLLMAPAAFLKRPARWLEAISRYQATTSGGPNFAYDLCTQRLSDEDCAGLDLTSWRVAFNGAEPIRADTLRRFAERFAPYGFDANAFCPCYGLAEGTLLVSSATPGTGAKPLSVDSAGLERREILPSEGDGSLTLVSSGQVDTAQKLAIVDPELGTPLAERTVGEIWVQGESVGQGYWQQEESTAATFGARLPGAKGTFLRTGDLGFLSEGELFVTGRIKDLIILRGRNLYPQDIEASAASAHAQLRPGCGAAFSIDAEGEERLVLVQEISRHARGDLEPVFDALRQTVATEYEAALYDIVLIREATLLKTSSGKIRRQACRAAYLAGDLRVVATAGVPEGEGDILDLETENSADDLPELLPLPMEERVDLLTTFLRREAARLMRRSQVAIDKSLGAQGLDSLTAVELAHSTSDRLGIGPDLEELLADLTIQELASTLAQRIDERPAPPTTPSVPMAQELPLTRGQRALVFLERLAPLEGIYNIAALAHCRGAIDSRAFASAVSQLAERHPMLRATVHEQGGTLHQRITSQPPSFIFREDSDSPLSEVHETLRQHAFEPFNLETGPLFRVELVQRGPEDHLLLLAVHHVVSDFWSLVVLLDELGHLYQAAEQGAEPNLKPLAFHYGDFITAQERFLASAEGLAARDFWLRTLGDDPIQLELSTDRPRSNQVNHAGESVPLLLPEAEAEAFRQLARQRGATVFMALSALWGALLHRLTQQAEIWLGVPTAGRDESRLASVVGYFVNPIVLRQRFSGAGGFTAHLDTVRSDLLAAFHHQGYPFALLAEALQPDRSVNRSPLFQSMFILQSAPGNPELASFALGETGGVEPPAGIGSFGTMPWAGLSLTSVKLPRRPAQFDLTLSLAEDPDGAFIGSLHYASELFDRTTAQRLVEAFSTLLTRVTASPEQSLGTLDVLSSPARHQLLSEWNDQEHTPSPNTFLPAAFAHQAESSPHRTALVAGTETLTYQELRQKSLGLAHYLVEQGAGPGTTVGLALDRSADLVVALWAVLETGAAYLPLDPSYPVERLAFLVEDSKTRLLLCQAHTAKLFPASETHRTLVLEDLWPQLAEPNGHNAALPLERPAELPAYVIYTSGSTGRPKGVVVPHGTVSNFFLGMDQRVLAPPEERDPSTWLAVTSVSFDISVLELLFTLTRGFQVVLWKNPTASAETLRSRLPQRSMQFSLMYFSSDVALPPQERYRLLTEGVQYADRAGFHAVWTPERHFHAFGGLFPNPAVTSAAIAASTERVRIRAGSVVLPLHSPVRVAEEWAMVDNLSQGRVDVAFASGWQPDDFVLAPDNYRDRKNVMREGIEKVRELWRGGSVELPNGLGQTTATSILPPPIQPELPIWITAAGSPDTFALAGELGASVLTHLLGQNLEELAQKLAVYRKTFQEHHGDDAQGHVTLMLHTFVGEDLEQVRETVKEPFKRYLGTSFGLMKSLAPGQDLDSMSEEDLALLLERAFQRYFETSGLFGSPQQCLERIDELKEIGVDEVACLIDFGVDTDTVLASFEALSQVQEAANAPAVESPAEHSLSDAILEFDVSHLQCTPSLARTLLADPRVDEALDKLSHLMVGGEALPPDLAASLEEKLTGGQLLNMYGPTETTIWSAVGRVRSAEGVTLGRPILNTSLVVADRRLQAVPLRAPGELTLGGLGVVHGYHGRPALTAERFVPDPWSQHLGARRYRTGDRVRQRRDGRADFLGRFDHQVKIRGHRIELGEIESALHAQAGVKEALVLARDDGQGMPQLVAYVVSQQATAGVHDPSPEQQSQRLGGREAYRLPNGLTVAHLSSPQTNAIYREIWVDDVYRRHGVTLDDGATIFDVGANIGLFTLFVHQQCRNPRVFSFEPIPPTFDKLATNVALFDLGAEVFNLGISDREETASFTFYPEMAGLSGRFAEGDQETTHAIIRSWVERMASEKQGVQAVQGSEIDALVDEYLQSESFDCSLRSLSSVIREQKIETVDYLKVDVEGAELQVLHGIEAEDWPKIRQVVLEVHSKELLESCSQILEAQGFQLAVDEFIPVEDQIDYVYMVYGRRPEDSAASAAASPPVPNVSEETLRASLATSLPEVMVPTHLVLLDRLPLLPNGKIDRRALPVPGASTQRRTPFVPPGEGLEQQIADIWRQLLGTEEISSQDNFFETGGNSLLLMQAHGQLREQLGRDLSLVDLMRHPTISSLAQFLTQTAGAAAGENAEAKKQQLDNRMARQRKAFGRKRKRRSGPRRGEA